MNTRLQVEHPVTELVTGIDLVQWQLRIAAGEKLPFRQEQISPRGWAMECRITSEDASDNFLPSTGRIEYLHLPSGPGVRWDGGIESGSEIGLYYYDPMLAKLIVWGADREQAVTRMRRALVDLIILGVETSRDFHIRVMDDDEFRRGDIEIQWLERRLASILARPARRMKRFGSPQSPQPFLPNAIAKRAPFPAVQRAFQLQPGPTSRPTHGSRPRGSKRSATDGRRQRLNRIDRRRR